MFVSLSTSLFIISVVFVAVVAITIVVNDSGNDNLVLSEGWRHVSSPFANSMDNACAFLLAIICMLLSLPLCFPFIVSLVAAAITERGGGSGCNDILAWCSDDLALCCLLSTMSDIIGTACLVVCVVLVGVFVTTLFVAAASVASSDDNDFVTQLCDSWASCFSPPTMTEIADNTCRFFLFL